MPYSYKSALPRSAGSRHSRIRRYRSPNYSMPRVEPRVPAESLPWTHARVTNEGVSWFSRLVRGLKRFAFLKRFAIGCWKQPSMKTLSGAWQYKGAILLYLQVRLLPLVRLLPRARRWKSYPTARWQQVVILVALTAATGGISLFAFHDHIGVLRKLPMEAVLPAETTGQAKTPEQNVEKDRYGAAAVMLSPNSEERPSGTPVSAIIMHATGTATGQEAVNTFLNPDSKRSSHFVIDRNGAIIEMVPPRRRAFHAGRSILDGIPDLNNYSIGIELVGRNDGQPYSNAQYAATAALIGRLRMHHTIPDSRIVSHAAVAIPPGRKTDPVGFDFERLYRLLRT